MPAPIAAANTFGWMPGSATRATAATCAEASVMFVSVVLELLVLVVLELVVSVSVVEVEVAVEVCAVVQVGHEGHRGGGVHIQERSRYATQSEAKDSGIILISGAEGSYWLALTVHLGGARAACWHQELAAAWHTSMV